MRAILAATLFFGVSAHAATTYSYTGNTFDSGQYHSGLNLEVTFTVETELAPTDGRIGINSLLTNWSITDGKRTLTADNATSISFLLSVDQNGVIDDWRIRAAYATDHPIEQISYDEFLAMETNALRDQTQWEKCDDVFNYYGDWECDYSEEIAAVGYNPGVWTSSTAVPVPAAAWLFGSALAGLGWMRRKRTV